MNPTEPTSKIALLHEINDPDAGAGLWSHPTAAHAAALDMGTHLFEVTMINDEDDRLTDLLDAGVPSTAHLLNKEARDGGWSTHGYPVTVVLHNPDYLLPIDRNGRRRTPVIERFATVKEAEAWIEKTLSQVDPTGVTEGHYGIDSSEEHPERDDLENWGLGLHPHQGHGLIENWSLRTLLAVERAIHEHRESLLHLEGQQYLRYGINVFEVERDLDALAEFLSQVSLAIHHHPDRTQQPQRI